MIDQIIDLFALLKAFGEEGEDSGHGPYFALCRFVSSINERNGTDFIVYIDEATKHASVGVDHDNIL